MAAANRGLRGAVDGGALVAMHGTAKGGILFALAKRTGLPIRFIGVGEQLVGLGEAAALLEGAMSMQLMSMQSVD